MFEKEDIISEWTGKPYTKFNYTFNENEPIVGVLFGHYAPFTGPNGHGRLISSLKKIGAKYFLIATPNSNKPFDDEREMFSPTQRVEIINKYLKSENLNGKAIKYDMCRGGAKSQIGPLVKIAAEEFGMNIRPVLCFGPDREDLASEVCNKFGEIKNPNRCEYIIDYNRGTSGTEVRKLIRAGDIDGIMKATGYKKEVAEYLIKMRNENIKKYKLEEAIRGKVEIDFANIYDADKFKQEMEDRFEDDDSTYVSSNFRVQREYLMENDMDKNKIEESFKKVLNEDTEDKALTVKELIDLLSEYPPEEEVSILVFNKGLIGGRAGHAKASRVKRDYGTLYIEG